MPPGRSDKTIRCLRTGFVCAHPLCIHLSALAKSILLHAIEAQARARRYLWHLDLLALGREGSTRSFASNPGPGGQAAATLCILSANVTTASNVPPPWLRPSQARLSLSHRSPALALAWPRRLKPASGHSNLTGCGHRGSSLYSRHFPARWQRGITLLRLRHLYSIASLVSPSSGRIPQPTSSPFTPP